MTRWGKAGERITEAEALERARARRAKRNHGAYQAKRIAARDAAKERADWEAGHVRPYLITMCLDSLGLYGPEVDEACGVQEPTVDLWEAGKVYPTWEQLQALAELCQVLPRMLMRDTDEDPTKRMFLCGRNVRTIRNGPPTITSFTPEALAAAGLAPWPRRITPASTEQPALF